MTTCVHCDRSQQNHFKVIYEEEGNVYYRDCPIIKDGKRIGWHPTNRFTPRSEKQVMSEKRHIDCVVKLASSSDHPTHIYLKDGTKIVMKREGQRAWLAVEGQSVISPAVQTGSQPEWRELGQDEEIAHGDEVAHSKVENWAPVTDSVWLTPTVYPCLKFRRRVEAPQPAQTAGESEPTAKDWKSAYDQLLRRHEQTLSDLVRQQPCPRCAGLERERDALQQVMAEDAFHVLRIRCTKHVTVAQQNTNEYSGGECGACIAEERDTIQAKLTEAESANALAVAKIDEQRRTDDFYLAERTQLRDSVKRLEKERDATWDALMEAESTFPEPWFSVGTPSNFAKHIANRLLDSKAKVERLEVALREIREITLPSKVGGAGSGYTIAIKCGRIANAALAGEKE